MRFSLLCVSWLVVSTVFSLSCSSSGGRTEPVQRLPEVPAAGGYAAGVSAPFVGRIEGGRIVAAGGCNFPGVPAAQGGSKRFYDDIFVFDPAVGAWQAAGRLPKPLAYGASATMPEGVICAGGTDSAGRAVRDAFLIAGDTVRTLAPLPEAMDNCAGAALDGRFYVAGDTLFCIYDPSADAWQRGAVWPGAERRVQPVLVAQAGRVWLFGGYDPAGPEFVHRGGYGYDPSTGAWEAVAGPEDADGEPLLAAGGAGVAWGEDSILCVGGVNAAVFAAALQRGQAIAADPAHDSLRQAQREYMEREPVWYRFNDRVAVFHPATGRWSLGADRLPQGARAGAGAVVLQRNDGAGSGVVLFNGEIKPGVRTPEVWLWRLSKN